MLLRSDGCLLTILLAWFREDEFREEVVVRKPVDRGRQRPCRCSSDLRGRCDAIAGRSAANCHASGYPASRRYGRQDRLAARGLVTDIDVPAATAWGSLQVRRGCVVGGRNATSPAAAANRSVLDLTFAEWTSESPRRYACITESLRSIRSVATVSQKGINRAAE